ncbi:hypothetical protein HDU92_006351 [Lobulomyces angularis]|nr:hypothetical protein HDU92_006351 [Lobulomyces angularis]
MEKKFHELTNLKNLTISTSNLSLELLKKENDPKKLNLLLDYSKQLLLQLNDLNLDCSGEAVEQFSNKELTYNNFLSKLKVGFQKQEKINIINTKLHSCSYFMNLSNINSNQRLLDKISKGYLIIKDLKETISGLENTVSVEKENLKKLKVSLDNTRLILEESIMEYREKLNNHSKIIAEQQIVINKCYNNKVTQDLFMDSR